eukprot:14794387-Heterocapsa_arctica.AAC.1
MQLAINSGLPAQFLILASDAKRKAKLGSVGVKLCECRLHSGQKTLVRVASMLRKLLARVLSSCRREQI